MLAVLAERERALARLYQLLLRAARAELRRRSLPVILEGQQQDDLAHQAGDDALLAITSKLDRFRRESRFAPWADKFVMLEVSAKLGRHYWRNPPVPMSGDAWSGSRPGSVPIPLSTPGHRNWPLCCARRSPRC